MFSLIPFRKRETDMFRPFGEVEDMMKGFFGDVDRWLLPAVSVGKDMPAMNVYREDGNYVVEASAPGYNKEDLTVELNEGMLTITGRHSEEKKEEKKDYFYQEFTGASFTRSVKVPDNLSRDDIKAKYDNGILKVSIPVIEEKERENAKTITIE